jgi:hypothetical protein
MKYTIKPKADTTTLYTIRIQTTLKQQMDATRKLADEQGVDYNATLIDVMAEFNADLQARLAKSRSKGSGTSVNGSSNGSSDGAVPKAEVR